MKKLFFFLFLLLNISTFAQTYPVQVVAVMTPPHSSKIADYANPMGNRIHLQLITTDLSVQNRAITLHLEIKGNGISAVSSPLSTGIPNLRISGGEILSLTHSELAHYFQLRNLQGITTEQYASVLPDGVYSFCFRVKDATSGQWLSQNQCTMAYLMLNDPPLLNIPSDNEQVQVSDFQNILFSWTPRQINAVNVAYAFELREILDSNLDPKFAFEVSRKVHFEENLRTTTFVYDVSKPNLVPGRRYAWRIKAASTGGLAENSVFKNNGYSEIRSFVYAVNCSKPAFLLSQQQGKTSVKLLWQGNTSHQKYHIQYRKKGVENAQWFESFTRNTQTIIANLQSGAEYEFRVGATCEAERYGTTPSFAYADIQTFSIEKQEKSNENSYNCGIVPKIEITNQKPLASLIANEIFTAGDFPVQVLEAQGSNGIFSGKGFIKVPYLNDTKLSVSFENVKINTDNQLIEGVVKTTYDPSWGNVVEVDISKEIEAIKEIFNETFDKITKAIQDGANANAYINIWKEALNDPQNNYTEEQKTAIKEHISDKKAIKKLIKAAREKIEKEGVSNEEIKENLASNFVGRKHTSEIKEDTANIISITDYQVTFDKSLEKQPYKFYISPAGRLVILPSEAIPFFEEKINEINIPQGALTGFILHNQKYESEFIKKDGKWWFNGYIFCREKTKEGKCKISHHYVDRDEELKHIEERIADKDASVLEELGVKEFSAIPLIVGGTTTMESIAVSNTLRIGGSVLLRGVTLFRLIGIGFIWGLYVSPSYPAEIIGEGYLVDTLPIDYSKIEEALIKAPPLAIPTTIPFSVPKQPDNKDKCNVYVIYRTKENISEVAKYGITCQTETDGSPSCKRPAEQVKDFNKENDGYTYYYSIITPTPVSKTMALMIERAMTAKFIIDNEGKLPVKHNLPCFVKVPDSLPNLEKEGKLGKRIEKAINWLEEIIKQYGK